MIRTIVVAVVLWLLAGAAGWALAEYTDRLDGRVRRRSGDRDDGLGVR